MKEININVNINAPQICEVISKLAAVLGKNIEVQPVIDKLEEKVSTELVMPQQETPATVEVEPTTVEVEPAKAKAESVEAEVVETAKAEVAININELKATCAKAKAAGVNVGEILKSYGSTKLSSIDPVHYADIYDKVKAEQEVL